MKLNEIRNNPGAIKAHKRVGRGIGSGKGKTAGRGHKGQHARSGVAIHGFEGGQMPLHRRLPKRGFKNISKTDFAEVNLGQIQTAIDAKKLDAGKPIDAHALMQAGLIRRQKDGVRLLGKGTLKTKITIAVTGASKPALAVIEKLGGKVDLKQPKAKAKTQTEQPA